MAELFANSRDPDKTPRSAVSDLGLYCLPVTRLGSSVFNGLSTIFLVEFKFKTYVLR